MRNLARSAMPAAVAATLLLTGCGSDDSSGGGGGGLNFGDGGGSSDAAAGGPGGDDVADGPEPPSFGNDTSEGNPLQYRWESDKTVLVVTDTFSVLGDKELNATCPGNGNSGSMALGSAPMFVSCPENDINLRSFKIELSDDLETLTVTYDVDGSTETLTRGEDLRQQTLDEDEVRAGLLG